MELDSENDPAFLCGRVFALLESLEAATGEDHLFCSTFLSALRHPAFTLELRDNHAGTWLRRLSAHGRGDTATWYTKWLTDVAKRVNPSWDEVDDGAQALFILGYYGQRTALESFKARRENER